MITSVQTYANPDPRKSWIIKIEVTDPVAITARIIPDKFIADHNELRNAIVQEMNKEYETPEQLVLNIIECLNNELIPDWLEVVYQKDGITVKVEDRQPGKDHIKYPSTII